MNDQYLENLFVEFASSLSEPKHLQKLAKGIIGDDNKHPGLNGGKPLIYADYVASGRALQQVESFIQTNVLPYYANTHTQASFCGEYTTKLREQARKVVADSCQADKGYSVIFSGSGATSGINRLVKLLGVEEAARKGNNPLVLIGPYEHHSNILPWRESGAEVIEIAEAEQQGGPDLIELERILRNESNRLVVCAFSAASNVTGIVSDVEKISTLVKKYDALCVWDYAGGGPYLDINLQASDEYKIDAVVISCHKFLGGPGASGVLIVRNTSVALLQPSNPGGGTVKFVSPWKHDYSGNIIAREESGTPNIIGDIRAALCFLVKIAIGIRYQRSRLSTLQKRASRKWSDNPNLVILGSDVQAEKLPIFSFLVIDKENQCYLHQQLVTRMLSDIYGIQARGGCACAGSYAHRLLNINWEESNNIRASVMAGHEIEKPGWTRLNFSAVMSDKKVNYIIDSVNELALDANLLVGKYKADTNNATFCMEDVA